MKKIVAFILVIIVAVMCLVGCGEKSTLDRIKESGKLTMITEPSFAPFEYMNGGDIVGVDVAIAQKVADKLGVELEVVSMEFDALITNLQAGKGDLIAAGMTATDERKASVDFSVNYVDTGLYIIVLKDNSTIASVDDIVEGVTVGVQMGTTSDLYVSDNTDAEVGRYKTPADAVVALQAGKLDCVICDQLPAQDAVNNNADLRLLNDPFTVEQYAIAVTKGDEEFLAVVNEVLEEMLANGEIDALIAEHMELASKVEDAE